MSVCMVVYDGLSCRSRPGGSPRINGESGVRWGVIPLCYELETPTQCGRLKLTLRLGAEARGHVKHSTTQRPRSYMWWYLNAPFGRQVVI